MLFIKNHTPYLGKLRLKFERFPHYSTGNDKLNKVHLNLGFTKLVSRINICQGFDGNQIHPEKMAKISLFTGGVVKTYEWWEVKGPNGVFKSTQKPKHKKDIVYHGVLHNSFMYGNTYIGNIETGWWYYKNGFIVCDKYPLGVALKVQKGFWHSENQPMDEIIGYYGYSHRGGCLFKIGDRLFEEGYKPHVHDYTKEQWEKWHKQYRKRLKKADKLDKKWLCEDGVAGFIPFNMRGKKVIENWDEAIEAAKNLSKYLS